MYMSKNQIVHYCCGGYQLGNLGGVARYDYHISMAFPNRVLFQGPQQKKQMLHFLNLCKDPIIITDNHLVNDIPNKYKTFLVHHGVAKTHALREPGWGDSGLPSLCCRGQETMLNYRDSKTTHIVSISQFCTDEFTRYYNKTYTRFKNTKILHTSELDETRYKKEWNNKPVVVGNWTGVNKGAVAIQKLVNNSNNFKFNKLSVWPTQAGINDWNRRKQDAYLNSDIFLQLSLCEGNSYATLDALLCGIPVVSSNVGLFYSDVPEDCFVKIEWERNNDAKYVEEKLKYAWENKEELSKKGREWYLKNCRFGDWMNKMRDIINK